MQLNLTSNWSVYALMLKSTSYIMLNHCTKLVCILTQFALQCAWRENSMRNVC